MILTGDTHPIHLHLVQFQILCRRQFDHDKYEADRKAGTLIPLKRYYTGPAVKPPENESGWKDTVQMQPNEMTSIKVLFADYKGRFVWHCHIIEHEDNDMMRPFEVR